MRKGHLKESIPYELPLILIWNAGCIISIIQVCGLSIIGQSYFNKQVYVFQLKSVSGLHRQGARNLTGCPLHSGGGLNFIPLSCRIDLVNLDCIP